MELIVWFFGFSIVLYLIGEAYFGAIRTAYQFAKLMDWKKIEKFLRGVYNWSEFLLYGIGALIVTSPLIFAVVLVIFLITMPLWRS